MVDPGYPRLSIVRQCELVLIGRLSFYREPTPESVENLVLMRLIDEQCLLMPLCRSLPPLLCALSMRLNHAANWRPDRDSDESGTAATLALAVMGPIPGTVASRRPSGSFRALAGLLQR
jgi:hypothetical protein